jgi:hypothetical protein
MAVLALAAATWPIQAAAQGYPLNDTGQTQCFDAAHVPVACNAAIAGRPGQDGRFGRDAAATAGALAKQGGGEGGFDFTRVCMNGDAAGVGACAATPVANTGASPAATEWACTRDNVTGLVWSLQTRLAFWADAAAAAFAEAGHNGASRCGYGTGWRLPTAGELLSIVTYGGGSPAIDQAYFPATESSAYWTATPFLASANAVWAVRFTDGDTSAYNTLSAAYVRLVRSGS